jgi:peptidoglycan hydrolase-like protein with peptidoglycan-binding domain
MLIRRIHGKRLNMNQLSVIVLAALAGAGVTGAAVVLTGQDAGDAAFGSVRVQTELSPQAAIAWQGLRRPGQSDPAQQEQAMARPDSFRAPKPAPTAAPVDTITLARALQRELRRAGCYHGEINGSWNTSTRQAMKAFTDVANARLPVTTPDPVLLALIQGDQYLGCTERCVQDAKAGICRDDRVATPSPSDIKPIPASEESSAAMFEPPMALAGPKTSESDETVSSQKAMKRGNINRPARAEDWAAKLWRDSTP